MRGSVVKKGNNYFIVFRDPQTKKQKWVKTGTGSRRKAEKMLADIVNQVHQGVYADLEDITFQDFSELWLKDYAKEKVRETTYKRYSGIIRLHLNPYFGYFKLTQINPHMIEKYLAETNRATKLKPATMQKHLRLIKNMLKRAIIWGYLSRDPSQYIEGPPVLKEERRIPEKEEIQKLLEDVEVNDPDFYPLLLVAICTGARRGEVLGLSWQDVDFKESKIHIRRSLVLGKLAEPKTRAGTRHIDMGKSLASTLRKHKLSCPPSELGLVFPNKLGRPMDPSKMIRRHFLPALKRVGLQGLRFHDLRHVHNTYLYQYLPQLGISPQFIAKRMGHSSTKLGFDNYGHAMQAKSDIGDRIEEAILG